MIDTSQKPALEKFLEEISKDQDNKVFSCSQEKQRLEKENKDLRKALDKRSQEVTQFKGIFNNMHVELEKAKNTILGLEKKQEVKKIDLATISSPLMSEQKEIRILCDKIESNQDENSKKIDDLKIDMDIIKGLYEKTLLKVSDLEKSEEELKNKLSQTEIELINCRQSLIVEKIVKLYFIHLNKEYKRRYLEKTAVIGVACLIVAAGALVIMGPAAIAGIGVVTSQLAGVELIGFGVGRFFYQTHYDQINSFLRQQVSEVKTQEELDKAIVQVNAHEAVMKILRDGKMGELSPAQVKISFEDIN